MYATDGLEIYVADSTTAEPIFAGEAPAVEGYVIGRSDSVGHYVPDIDLTEFNAREQGVSRRHAALVRYRSMVHVVDLGSINGTYLNGVRLRPETPYALSAGDKLQMGKLVLIVKPAGQ